MFAFLPLVGLLLSPSVPEGIKTQDSKTTPIGMAPSPAGASMRRASPLAGLLVVTAVAGAAALTVAIAPAVGGVVVWFTDYAMIKSR